MRDYAKVAPQFWIGETGRELRTLGPETQVLALYLITSPHANMLGLYYLPLPLMSHETGIPLQGTMKALRRLSRVDFAYYDGPSEMVWVPEMARYQIGEALKKDDNRVKGLNKEYASLPNNPFLKDFYDKYHILYHLTEPRALKAPPKPPRSQEQDLEQDLEQEQESGERAHTHVQDEEYVMDGDEGKTAPREQAATDTVVSYTYTIPAAVNGFTPPGYIVPGDFAPSEAMLDIARKDAPHVDVDLETKRFKATVFQRAVLDWGQRWYKFILDEEARAPTHRNGTTSRTNPSYAEAKAQRESDVAERFLGASNGRPPGSSSVSDRDQAYLDDIDYRVDG